MDLILHKKFKLEEELKNSNLKVNYQALGAAMIYNEGTIPIEECAKSFNLDVKDVKKESKNIENIAKPKNDKSKKFLELIKS